MAKAKRKIATKGKMSHIIQKHFNMKMTYLNKVEAILLLYCCPITIQEKPKLLNSTTAQGLSGEVRDHKSVLTCDKSHMQMKLWLHIFPT